MRNPSLVLVLFLASCTSSPQLPPHTQPVVLCVLDLLRVVPGINEPSVYFVENEQVVMAFGYKGKDGRDTSHQIFVSQRVGDHRFVATGDFVANADLEARLSGAMESKCQVATGYTDSFMVVPRPDRWRVDMSKLEDKN